MIPEPDRAAKDGATTDRATKAGAASSRYHAAPGSALARLMAEPARFGFDAAIRVLMHVTDAADPAEAARFRSPPGLGFPTADITQVRADSAPAPPNVNTPVMALTGPTGVLPRYYTEILGKTLRDRSRAMHDFLDMLAHRFVAQFARAGTKYRPHRAADVALLARRPGEPAVRDLVAEALLAFTGHGTPHLTDRLASGAEPLLHFAGLMAARPRSADRLAHLVSDWLGRPVDVVQFAGAWLTLPPDQRTRMPRGLGAGEWNRLGVDAAIGVRAWDIQARIVLRIGPLDRRAFEALLPDRGALRRLVSLVRAYLGYETEFAINLVLSAPAVPPLRLVAGAEPRPRLGWNTWLPADGLGRRDDAADALFEAQIVESAGCAAEKGIE